MKVYRLISLNPAYNNLYKNIKPQAKEVNERIQLYKHKNHKRTRTKTSREKGNKYRHEKKQTTKERGQDRNK